jgi:hypothetical protein
MAEPDHPNDSSELESALEKEDPVALSKLADPEALKRLKVSEQIMGLQHERKKRTSRFALATEVVISMVAIGGFLTNMVQSYLNKLRQDEQATLDSNRWQKEFDRAARADKYRAFFETSALATDAQNPGKRLVGYALLQEFVQDKDYNDKATLMLREALESELRADDQPGLSEAHRAAVIAIVSALSGTRDCEDLERAARTIDFLGKRSEQTGDIEEAQEVFSIYVRRLVGRAALICPNLPDFLTVRRPLRDILIKLPQLGGLSGKVTVGAAGRKLAEILRDRCQAEMTVSGVSDCPAIYQQYQKLCGTVPEAQRTKEQAGACRVFEDPRTLAELGATQAKDPPPTASP